MSYAVKEIFYTLQGEGSQSGRAAVFCRFAGCNLWTGREEDRATAVCQFCDTEFVGTDGEGGGSFKTAPELARAVADAWPKPSTEGVAPLVVCTGGEPLLQLDQPLVEEFHAAGFEIAVETNGTQPAPAGIDWLCVSPKAGSDLLLKEGNELKLVYPQLGPAPDDFLHLAFDHFFLQPMDGPELAETTRVTVQYCLENPRWRVSLQTHKYLGIP